MVVSPAVGRALGAFLGLPPLAEAPLDYEVDPWGCRKLREHLNRRLRRDARVISVRMWFGEAEGKAEEKERPAATNPAMPVAKSRASLGRPVVARSLAAPVARTAISPRVEAGVVRATRMHGRGGKS